MMVQWFICNISIIFTVCDGAVVRGAPHTQQSPGAPVLVLVAHPRRVALHGGGGHPHAGLPHGHRHIPCPV